MTHNEFAEAMAVADRPALDGRLDVLRRFCEGVRAYTRCEVECWLARGYSSNLGREWRVLARPAGGGPETMLLRAFLGPRQVTFLDLYDEDLEECAGDDLAARLKDFAADSVLLDSLRLIRCDAGTKVLA